MMTAIQRPAPQPGPTRQGAPRPAEVRDMILGDHCELRGRLDRLARLLDRERLEDHGDQIGLVRAEFRELAQFFTAHLDFEDQFLAPLLREDYAWGDIRAEGMLAHHREQRDELAKLGRLIDNRARGRHQKIAALERFVAALELDMQEEEAVILRPEVIGEQLVVVEAGA